MAFPPVEWIAALAFVSVPLAALLLVLLASGGRLMRCPETGGVGFVHVYPLRAGGKAVELCVRRCDLWPPKRDCGQGCLVRSSEIVPGYEVRLYALRPFERS